MSDFLSICTDADALVTWYQSLGFWGAFVSFAMMTLCALTILPAEGVAIANGMVYGPVWGSILNWSSAMFGANLAFCVARWKGPQIVEAIVGAEKLKSLEALPPEQGMRIVLIARLIPLIPFFALNYFGGLCGLKWLHFNLATAIGISPLVVALSVLGDGALHLHWTVWVGTLVACVAMLFALKRIVPLLSSAKPSAL